MAFLVKDKVVEPLYCIVPYFNPWRWKSREKHTLRALKHFHDSGAVIVLVEVAFNRREFTWADSGLDGTLAECNILDGREFKHIYVPLRSSEELWLKENSINVAIARALPYNWQQVAWLDSDVVFIRPNWVGEAIHKLQHHSFLQMFSHARDVGPNYEMLPEDYPHANGIGFIRSYQDGDLEEAITGTKPPIISPTPKIIEDLKKLTRDIVGLEKDELDLKKVQIDVKKLEKDFIKLEEDLGYGPYNAKRVWPGLAWACTREAYDTVGGLLDFAIWGGGDWHMANALVDRTNGMMRNDLHPSYKALVNAWHEKALDIRKDVGLMEGSIIHNWHGKKSERGYNSKHSLLAQIGFDPIRHLKRDYQGLYQLHDDGTEAFVRLRDELRKIAKERNEDSIDI